MVNHISTLKKLIEDDEITPYRAGILPVKKALLNLFYSKPGGTDARRINFANASADELERLSAACQIATVLADGKESDSVDENIHRGKQLSANDIATNMTPEGCGFIESVKYEFLHGREVRLESQLNKLQLYGEGDFYKEHTHAEGGRNHCAVLILVFPTSYEGGQVTFYSDEKEWMFDPHKLIQDAYVDWEDDSTAPVCYVISQYDDKQEIARVVSGYRVSLSYNIYTHGLVCERNEILRATNLEDSFVAALKAALADQDFLPEGGALGFGLIHEYPLETGKKHHSESKTRRVFNALAGVDAIIRDACVSVGLQTSVRFLFEDGDKKFVLHSEDDFPHDCRIDIEEGVLFQVRDPIVIECGYYESDSEGCGGIPEVTFVWVTPANRYNTEWKVYYNRTDLWWQEGLLLLYVEVPPPKRRGVDSEQVDAQLGGL